MPMINNNEKQMSLFSQEFSRFSFTESEITQVATGFGRELLLLDTGFENLSILDSVEKGDRLRTGVVAHGKLVGRC
jgi:hypothetical protein